MCFRDSERVVLEGPSSLQRWVRAWQIDGNMGAGGVGNLILWGGMKNLKHLGESKNFETFEGE